VHKYVKSAKTSAHEGNLHTLLPYFTGLYLCNEAVTHKSSSSNVNGSYHFQGFELCDICRDCIYYINVMISGAF